jgi:deazaflavin-dependent oxidoreductase (nitroreductase family)
MAIAGKAVPVTGANRGIGQAPVEAALRQSPSPRTQGREQIMANSAPDLANDYNARIIEEFRANQGRVGGPWASTTLILIHHLGAKSGTERVSPLGCFPQSDGRLVIVASNGGSPTHPDWYHNLKVNPRVGVEVGSQTFTVLAQELGGTARAELWPKLVAEVPQLGEFQTRATRQIPVFMLTRQD